MTKAVEAGLPKLRIEEAAARRQARIDRGEDVIVGVNKYQARERSDRSKSATSTMPRCATQQIAPSRPRSGRAATQASVEAALEALAEGARPATATCSTLAVGGRAARATVGEISDAMEKVLGRYPRRDPLDLRRLWRAYEGDSEFAAHPRRHRGIRARGGPAARASWSPRWARTATTAAPRWSPPPSPISASTSISARCSRRPRKWPRRRSKPMCHVVGVSSLAAGHKTLVPAADRGPERAGRRRHHRVRRRGHSARRTTRFWRQAGVAAIFGPARISRKPRARCWHSSVRGRNRRREAAARRFNGELTTALLSRR